MGPLDALTGLHTGPPVASQLPAAGWGPALMWGRELGTGHCWAALASSPPSVLQSEPPSQRLTLKNKSLKKRHLEHAQGNDAAQPLPPRAAPTSGPGGSCSSEDSRAPHHVSPSPSFIPPLRMGPSYHPNLRRLGRQPAIHWDRPRLLPLLPGVTGWEGPGASPLGVHTSSEQLSSDCACPLTKETTGAPALPSSSPRRPRGQTQAPRASEDIKPQPCPYSGGWDQSDHKVRDGQAAR